MRRIGAIWLALSLAGGIQARQDVAVCGSHPDRLQEELHLHRQSDRVRKALRAVLGAESAAPSSGRDIGSIALIEDGDGVVARRNNFNLHGRTLTFSPSASDAARYRFETGAASYDSAVASSSSPLTGLGDDDTARVSLPFTFPFFGAQYTSVFVNSDGNLTFNSGDTSTAERSLGRLTAGPPRIAGLFRDLDPSRVPGSVRLLSEPGRFVVSYVGVPEYQTFGTGPLQTFQIRLFPGGRVEFAYQDITTRSAVVGIAPGNLLGSSSVVSFLTGSGQEFSSAIAERFTGVEEVDIVLTAQKFYERHEDAYDYLVIFNSLGIPASPGAVAYQITLRNNRSGYGDLVVDNGREFGSRQRLQAIMNMGPLSQYPVDPRGILPARALARDTPLTILGHEAGHLFLAFASVRDPANPRARPMLGRQSAHWNFAFNSEASLLEGNRIRDNGENASPRFTTTATVEGYSPLDQYLMGLRAAEEVPPTFLVMNPTVETSSRMPQPGVSFDGQRRNIHVEEIIEAEGRRTPDHTVAQRGFRFAFILVASQGLEPASAQITQLETYRTEFESFFRLATSERATAETALRRSLSLSTFPASGVLSGSTATATVAIENPAASPLTVLLTTRSGTVSVPSSVTIASGATSAAIPIRGVRPGVDDLIADIPGGLYSQAQSRVQVLDAPGNLTLQVVSGAGQLATPGVALPQPVVFRVADINNLPYPGTRVQASASTGGQVDPAVAVADAQGRVSFRYTPGPEPLNELRATIVGASASASVSALGRPFFTASSVVNAASFSPVLAPGSLASVFGANLAGGATAAAGYPPPTVLAGVRLTVAGRPTSLLYVSDRQINFLLPTDLSPGETTVVVTTPLGTSEIVRISLQPVAPGIFQFTGGMGAVVVAGTGSTTDVRAAAPGEFLEIYTTGLGAVRPSSTPGLQETVLTPQVFLAQQPARVVFSGLTPGFVGLYQINAETPAGAPSGWQPLSLTIGGAPSNTVQVRVR